MKNIKDFIDFHAEKANMTREEYVAYYLSEAMTTGKGYMNQKELIKFLSKLPKDFRVSIPSPNDNGKYVYFDHMASRNMPAKEAIKWVKKYKPEKVESMGDFSAKVWNANYKFINSYHDDKEKHNAEYEQKRELEKSMQIGGESQLLDTKVILKNIDRFETINISMEFDKFDHQGFADMMSRDKFLD